MLSLLVSSGFTTEVFASLKNLTRILLHFNRTTSRITPLIHLHTQYSNLTMYDISIIAFALAILHAGYLIQLSFRQPSTRKITSSSESWPMYLAASPLFTSLVRLSIICISVYHMILSTSISSTRAEETTIDALPPGSPWTISERVSQKNICPQTMNLDPGLFTWSPRTVAALLLLYASSTLRFAAYAQLGSNFTYRIAKPDELVTTGLYAYVRHPSYTGLIGVLGATHILFFGQRGMLSCWMPGWIMDERAAVGVSAGAFGVAMWLFMVRRVREEEEMMERAFGGTWRDYRARTRKFVPFVL
jgi:protein-S-isoprenylcysteine O-methyltransferase Ste14